MQDACRDFDAAATTDAEDCCCAEKNGVENDPPASKSDRRTCACCHVAPVDPDLPTPVMPFHGRTASRPVAARLAARPPEVLTIPDIPPPRA